MSSSVLFPTPIILVGSVLNPYAVKFADNQQGGVQAIYDQGGAPMVSKRVGDFATASLRNASFSATAAAVTIPVNAASLASVFALYNPPGSGVWAELVGINMSAVLATTVVNGYGIYYSTVAKSALATFTTAGTVVSNLVGGPQGKVQFWTSAAHSGTPTLQALCYAHGAVTNANLEAVQYKFDGTVLIPPGVLASVAATTAASTTSGITLSASWIEYNQ
jgi:hypothetical protein